MGFFSLSVKCSVCGNDIGWNRFQLRRDIWICPNCLEKCGGLLNFTELKKMDIQEIQKKAGFLIRTIQDENFKQSRIINEFLSIDEENKKIKIVEIINNAVHNTVVIQYTDIIKYETLIDGETITNGGLGSAAIGGLLFGGMGAIVGSNTGSKTTKSICTELKIKITCNSFHTPYAYINFIPNKLQKDSYEYQKACEKYNECTSALDIILNSVSKTNDNIDLATQLRQYKQLLDEEIITKEEFEQKKKQLLGL